MKLPLSKLEPWNPFENVVWGMDLDRPITREEIAEAIEARDFMTAPDWSPDDFLPVPRRDHVARVAYLVVHGWDDAIEFEVCPQGGWPIYDGNHRLAAAFYRGAAEIEVDVGGFLDYAAELLEMPEEELVAFPV